MSSDDQQGLGGFSLNCPLPNNMPENIQIGHGGGGRLTQQLIDHVFMPVFMNQQLGTAHDGAVIESADAPLAFSTDSHVVHPIEFPGGDIGSLAIHGTANDLAMCGARPCWMSAGFILEEGLPIAILQKVVRSMQAAASEIGIRIVTGDTKVVERGKGDSIYINTSGIGVLQNESRVSPFSVREGDVLVLSGDIGRHGMAIMAQREGLDFESPIESDCAHLWPVVEQLYKQGILSHCLRDLTRGGLAAAAIEIARTANKGVLLEESEIQVDEPVRGACEVLGLDPLHVANEGRFLAIVAPEDAERTLDIMKTDAPGGARAAIIGKVDSRDPGSVRIKSQIGVERILDRPSGEQLPRIC